MESAWPAAVRRGHWALAASMACLASAVVSGGGVAWQPSAAARSAGTHQMGRMTDLRWGKARTIRALLGCRKRPRSEEHTSELQTQSNLVCRLLLEKKKKKNTRI